MRIDETEERMMTEGEGGGKRWTEIEVANGEFLKMLVCGGLEYNS